jgi:threonylcarbamoyladenosine tRNA methylthiotransferase MtaB
MLLRKIIEINGLERLRISSIEINEITDEVIEVFKNSKILVDHLHIPIQSGSDQILKDMNRKYDKEYFCKRVDAIRKIRPDISLTTDIIVGFPGETEELFLETIETVNKIKFSKIHVFPFSSNNAKSSRRTNKERKSKKTN